MEPFIGQITLFAGNFPPRGWAFCQGQTLSIAQNNALFAILGTTYGGDGITNFLLPDLRGRVPIQQGQGPGLSPYQLGEQHGAENVTLNASQMPGHNHLLAASNQPGSSADPVGSFPAALNDSSGSAVVNGYLATSSGTLNPAAISAAGGGQPFSVVQPNLGLNYIIALEGIFPSRD